MIHEWDPDVRPRARRPDRPRRRRVPRSTCSTSAGGTRPSGAWGELYVRRPGMAAAATSICPSCQRRAFRRRVDRVGGAPLYRTGDRVRVERPGVLRVRRSDRRSAQGRRRPARTGRDRSGARRPSRRHQRAWCACGRPVSASRVARDASGAVSAPTCPASSSTTTASVRSVARSTSSSRRPRPGSGPTPTSTASSPSQGAARTSDYDCLHLLSGGKDSTYALYQLVERGAGGSTPSRSTTGSSPTAPRRTFGAASPTSGSPTSSSPPTR